MKIEARLLEKPWGQLRVPHVAGCDSDSRIGEVCFDSPRGQSLPVLIKYLYTSERLSIQVHPNDEQARALGHPNGKDEMWIVLDAQPGATIGIGLKRDMSDQDLRAAVRDGTIEDVIDWRPVAVGDVIYNPAGTVHAAGAGLVLLEVQQAIDLTYRLYDYGRPRTLHLDEGLAVARGKPHADPRDGRLPESGSAVLVNGPHFGAAWCRGELPEGLPLAADHYQLVVVEGAASVGGTSIAAGECGLARSLADLELASDTVAVVAWPAAAAQPATEAIPQRTAELMAHAA